MRSTIKCQMLSSFFRCCRVGVVESANATPSAALGWEEDTHGGLACLSGVGGVNLEY